MTAGAAHGGPKQVVGLEEACARSLPAPGMLELVTQHRAERAVGNARKLAPDGEPVRRVLMPGDALAADRTEHGHRFGPDDAGRMKVGKGRRARGTLRRDDVGDDRGRRDSGIGAGRGQLLAEVFGIEQGASLA